MTDRQEDRPELYIDIPSDLLNRKTVKMTAARQTKTPKPASVREILAKEALKNALYQELRTRLVRGTAGAVVVTVPTPAWVTQIGRAVEDLNDHICVVLKSDGKKREDDFTVTVSKALADGVTVVAVTPSADYLPAIFRTVTDETVTIEPPLPKLVSSVIRLMSSRGRIPATFSSANTGVLDFDELAGLVVADGDARIAAEKVMRAVESKTRMSKVGELLPDLETATEFGEARLWAMDLKLDLEDIRAGRLSASQADRGAVFYGPPGTGKTLLARSIGQFLGIPVIVESMGGFFAGGAGYLDSVIKQQRAAFEKARAAAPAILFLDEIDATPDLDQISSRGRDWWAPVVADFLTLLDGAASDRSGVIVIGATNRINAVAPAILRPGRLERAIYLGPPDASGAVRVLRHHLDGELIGENLDRLGEFCAGRGMTPAVIMESVRAARRAARRLGRPILLPDLEARLMPKIALSDNDRRRIAVHEAGHALMGEILAPGKLASVSLFPVQPGDGGSTVFRVPDDRIDTAESYEKRVSITLAGRASEIVVLGSPSTGAGGPVDSDLAHATTLLASAAMSLGLGSSPRWRCEPQNSVSMMNLDREVRQEIELELARIAEGSVAILRDYHAALSAVAARLERDLILTGKEVREIVAKNPPELRGLPSRGERGERNGAVSVSHAAQVSGAIAGTRLT